MFSIRKINPMVRAVGTMGAVAALAGGVTFAALTSNTVALTSNTLATASAGLAIGTAVDGTDCVNSGVSTAGLTSDSFNTGEPVSKDFCLANTGDVDLLLTATIPENLANSVADDTTLKIDCETQGMVTAKLSAFSSKAFENPLPAGEADRCTVTAELTEDYDGNGGETIKPFTINFVGTDATEVPDDNGGEPTTPVTPPADTPDEQ